MAQRFPGSLGLGRSKSEKIDSGTLARTTSRMPGPVSGDTSAKQKSSWTRPIRDLPQVGEETVGKLGEIYFQTNEDILDEDDKRELDKLCSNLKSLLSEGYSFHLLCTGNTDYRASESYNLSLGDRRAESVKKHIDGAVTDSGLSVFKATEGESDAQQPGRGKKRVPPSLMAFDRRVDITFGAVAPPVRIGIAGNWIHTRSLQKLELDSGGRILASTSERVSVMITTDYQVVPSKGSRQATVECTVTRMDTNELLFKASAALDADRIIMRKGYKSHPESRVTRVLRPGDKPPPGAKIFDVRDRATTNEAGDLLPVIFKQLKGNHPNITERVKEMLNLSTTAATGP